MQRDMELIRKILITIEKNYIDVALDYSKVNIDGYDMKTIAYHCSILYDAGLISDFKGHYGGNELLLFWVGHLTWEGHEFLDQIENETVWNKTKATIKEKGIPFVLDAVKDIATAITASMIQSAIKGI